MKLTVVLQAGARDVVVECHRRDATVRDFVDALEPTRVDERTIAVGGRVLSSHVLLGQAGLVEGAVVEVISAGDVSPEVMALPSPAAAPVVGSAVVAVVGGVAAGAVAPIPASGELVLGRGEGVGLCVDDQTVSPLHARVRWAGSGLEVCDGGSLNGTRVDGRAVRSRTRVLDGCLLGLGATEATIRFEPLDRPAGLDDALVNSLSPLPFNRPPRLALPPVPTPIVVPDPPAETARRVAFSIAAIAAPIVMGLVMAKVMGNIRFALFAFMSPVMFIGNYVATRRRNSRDSKSSQRQFVDDLESFRSRLEVAVSCERARREALVPDPAEVVRRATLPSTRLWERRTDDADFLLFRAGRAGVSWQPPVDADRVAAATQLIQAVEVASAIPRCPVEIDLSAGGVVGLVGERSAALALARSLLVQAGALHGPADLAVGVLASPAHSAAWEWTKWLPHARATLGAPLLSANAGASESLMAAMLESRDQPRLTTLLLVDDDALTSGRHSATRQVLRGEAGPIAGIVLADTADRLPSMCQTVVQLYDDVGDACLSRPQRGFGIDHMVVAGIDDVTALRCARSLARFEDPELNTGVVDLPTSVRLHPLLALGDGDDEADAIRSNWAHADPDPALRVPVGAGVDGPVELDLITDGPHALIGGTTGSGKSELLRSLIVAMAARVGPQHLVFVLIDYKGGSAFDECSRLPHTVGVVTDLDGYLSERALRSLEAELEHRERLLRDHHAQDLGSYLDAGSPAGPLPRLVVVIDEFATLANDLPDFMGALLAIAQRGRSLGVHLVLATQRPSGAINANIKANTNIRIALRVQDPADSIDVIDRPEAAAILRSTPGRAFVRLGPGEVVAVQTPLSTLSPRRGESLGVNVRPLVFGEVAAPDGACETGDAPTDLTRLVDGCREAFAGQAMPRCPWLPMLEESIALGEVLNNSGEPEGVIVGVADDPARQRRTGLHWQPSTGHLGLFGATGSGTTSALIATICAAVTATEATCTHVYCVDFGGGSLSGFWSADAVGAVIKAGEQERQARLISWLTSEVRRRRDLGPDHRGAQPRLIVAIDGLVGFLAEFNGIDGLATIESLTQLFAEGPSVGLSFAFTADRSASVPAKLLARTSTKLMFKHLDPADFGVVGLRPRDLPAFVPGRAIESESNLVVQVGFVGDLAPWVEAMNEASAGCGSPQPITVLPRSVDANRLVDHLDGGDPRVVPVGITESDRSICSLRLDRNTSVFVGGPSGSGVSSTLGLVAAMTNRAQPDAVLAAVADDRSPLRNEIELFDAVGPVAELGSVFELALSDTARRWVIAVDDAHMIDEAWSIETLSKADHCQVIVGARSDQLHGQFNHWTRQIRQSGVGILLQPRLDIDGDLLAVRLPRSVNVPMTPGRGFLVTGGTATLLQVAHRVDSETP